MSVKIGSILGGRKTIIAGAPRSKYAGQVLLFEPTDDGMTIAPDHYLSGEQFGSGFGYDIAVLDINGDGLVLRRPKSSRQRFLTYCILCYTIALCIRYYEEAL